MKMTYVNGFFFPYSALKSLAVAQAMPTFFALISRKISSFLFATFSI